MLSLPPRLLFARVFVAALTLVVLSAAANPSEDLTSLRAQLAQAHARAVSDFSQIASETGLADQIVARLDADQTDVMLATDGNSAAVERLKMRVSLDLSLVNQLTGGLPLQASSNPGASLMLLRSSADKTLQPLAIYLPAGYASEKSLPLLFMLHGQGETETDLITEPVLRKLADASGVVVAAPGMRGDAGVTSATTADVDDALAYVQSHYGIDRRRTYLGGVSMGGFNAFMLAPANAASWKAVLSIAGSLTNNDKDEFVRTWRAKPVFLVIGSDDSLVNPAYVRGASQFLNANGVECHYYEQRGGVHSLDSVEPALEQAWNDMLSGVRESAELPSPSPLPRPSTKY